MRPDPIDLYDSLLEKINALEERVLALERATPNPSWITPALEETRTGVFKKPTLQEVWDRCQETNMLYAEGEKFWNYYESNGWRVGRNAMKSWTSALANWKKGWEEKQVATRPTQLATVWELKSVMTAKELAAKSLRDKYAAEVSTGWLWNNEERRQEYIKLRIEIKRLNEQIARMG